MVSAEGIGRAIVGLTVALPGRRTSGVMSTGGIGRAVVGSIVVSSRSSVYSRMESS